jgi:hypothetical protein
MAEPRQVKVVFPYGEGAETMWADPLGASKYRLDNVPLFAYGVSLGDVFLTKHVDGDDRPYFERVVERSPNWTYRLILSELPTEALDAREHLLKRVLSYGDHSGLYDKRFVSINVPDSVNREAMDGVVEQGEAEGFWQSEVSSGPDLPVSASD